MVSLTYAYFLVLGYTSVDLLQRAGRITWPAGTLTMTMNANAAVKHDLLLYLDRLQRSA